MSSIVFPTSSSPGLYPQESSGRLINAFVEKTESGSPGQTLWRRSAGLYFLGSAPSPHTRGFQEYLSPGDTTSGGWTYAFWVTDEQISGLVKDLTHRGLHCEPVGGPRWYQACNDGPKQSFSPSRGSRSY